MFLLFIFFLMMVSSLVKEKTISVSDHSVLEVNLNFEIRERSSDNPFQDFSLGNIKTGKRLGLNDILRCIRNAKNDIHIDGIFLNLTGAEGGLATIEEIRSALLDFKSSGKFIYAYSEGYSQREYYLASLADKI